MKLKFLLIILPKIWLPAVIVKAFVSRFGPGNC